MKHFNFLFIAVCAFAFSCNTTNMEEKTEGECKNEVVFESEESEINNFISSIKIFESAASLDISFSGSYTGYITGNIEPEFNTAAIARTEDGGKTWQAYQVFVDSLATTYVSAVYAKSREEAFVSFMSLSGGGTAFSSDGGCSWKKIGNERFHSLFFVDNLTGFMAGWAGDILKTNDGGKEWKKVFEAGNSENGYGAVENIFFTGKNTGYAWGGGANPGIAGGFFPSGSVYKTTDGGETWNISEEWNKNEYPTEIIFINDDSAYAFTFDNHVYKTSDGGISWTFLKDLSPDGGGSYFSAIISRNNDIYIGTSNNILVAKDDFKTVDLLCSVENSEFIKICQPSEDFILALSANNSPVIRISAHPHIIFLQ
jgi:photosystem II stability/assembly factor-like uncharacterized protein